MTFSAYSESSLKARQGGDKRARKTKEVSTHADFACEIKHVRAAETAVQNTWRRASVEGNEMITDAAHLPESVKPEFLC